MKIKESVKAIIMIALVAGTADAFAAIVVYQANPIRLFQMISSGVLGRNAAFSGGIVTFIIGLLIHYFIAACWAVFFFVLYKKIAWLRKNTMLIILGFGLFVWAVMNLVVVPLSLINRAPLTLSGSSVAALVLIVAVSLPIVLLTRRAHKELAYKSESAAA